MNRINNFIELCCISGVIGVIIKFFGGLKLSYIVLLILLTIDTLTGMAVAIKYKKFNSKGLSKFLKKTITYTTSIITVRLLEIGVLPLLETMLLSQIMVTFLEVIETVSILENLTLLGVPIPSNFIPLLIKNLKIPGLDKALKSSRNLEKDIVEIEEIRRYHIPTFKDDKLRRLLEIKFSAWKCTAMKINDLFTEKNKNSNEMIYYKVMATIELCFKDIEYQLREAYIPRKYICGFDKLNQPKLTKWIQRVERICFSDETVEVKKQQLIDGITIILYQMIIDARKQAEEDPDDSVNCDI